MSVLDQFVTALGSGAIEIVDLTARLESSTPVIQLPPPFANTVPFSLSEVSRYDERGPAWYWNDITTGEHTGTHFDAPVHWITGRDGLDIAQVPAASLIAPAVVLDFSEHAAQDPDFLLEIEHVKQWEAEHGPLPEGGWLLYRTGWDTRSGSQEEFLNANETGPHTPGISVACAQWLAEPHLGARAGHRDGGHRRRRRALVRPAVPLPLLAAGRREIRADSAAEPGPAARHRRGRDRRPAADHRRVGQPGAGAGPGRARSLMPACWSATPSPRP